MNNLAIIPARSGSKGLKDKNIRELNGIPLLEYSIKAAMNSKMFSEIMVSTDSAIYKKLAEKCGAKVPFLREADTSTDTASSWDVVKEVLIKYHQEGMDFDTVTLLQPTSPLRTARDIINAYELYKEKNATAVVSVCEMEHSPLWSNVLTDTLSMDGFLDGAKNRQRQQLDRYFRINGAIYIVDVEHLLADKNIYDTGSYAYIMPRERSVDIDTQLDFMLAETILKHIEK